MPTMQQLNYSMQNPLQESKSDDLDANINGRSRRCLKTHSLIHRGWGRSIASMHLSIRNSTRQPFGGTPLNREAALFVVFADIPSAQRDGDFLPICRYPPRQRSNDSVSFADIPFAQRNGGVITLFAGIPFDQRVFRSSRLE